MLNKKYWLLSLPLLASLSGCVISIGEGHEQQADYQERQQRNLQTIEALSMGSALDSVRERMGQPDFIEAFSKANADYKVLFYRTQRTKADGDTTRDETTPLVFRNGQLIGYGQKIYEGLIQQP